MKRGDFSYTSGHTQSHASLGRLRHQNHESRADSISRDILYSKPNVKYYSHPDSNKPLAKKANAPKSDEELRHRVKQLEYELKKKITDNCYLVKLFKTKNSAEVAHLDIYLQVRQLEEHIAEKDTLVEELKRSLEEAHSKEEAMQERVEEAAREIEDLLREKDEQEIQHTHEIETFSFQIDEFKKKCGQELAEKESQLAGERKMREEKDMLLREIKKQYEEHKNKVAKLHENLKQKEEESRHNQARDQTIEQLEHANRELHDELEKSALRQQEKEAVNQELNSKCEELLRKYE